MNMIADAAPANRPYAPPSNVTAVLGRLRSRNLPERIDIEYLRDANVPAGSLGRTIFALNFLGLVKDEVPTAALRSIAKSTDEEYRGILSGLIREAYREVFESIDPAEDAQDRIVNFFRRYTPASQRARMVIFFLGMCREAGIPTLDTPRQRTSGVSNGAKAPRAASHTPARQPAAASKSGQLRLRGEDRIVALGDIPPALAGLVRSLPPEGTPLSQNRREQWLIMARATLDFVYPDQASTANLVEATEE